MDEIIDIVDEYTGKITGDTIGKNEAHRLGIWHSSIHLIVISKDRDKILLQKRCKEKKFFPNVWDVTVGGHIASGENDLEALRRELKEELGLDLEDYSYEKIGVIKEKLTNNGIISNEFVHIYLICDDIDIDNIRLQVEEVEDIRWFTKKEFERLIQDDMVINHVKEYKTLRKNKKI